MPTLFVQFPSDRSLYPCHRASCYRCVYRQLKRGRSGDEVAEPGEKPAHPCSRNDAFCRNCNSRRRISGPDANASRPRQCVVHTFTPDRSDQPFHKAILPRRGWCSRLVPDAHGAQSARDDAAIDPVAIADEVVRSVIPGKCLRNLTCNPFCRRICCDVDPDEVSAVEPPMLARSGYGPRPTASHFSTR